MVLWATISQSFGNHIETATERFVHQTNSMAELAKLKHTAMNNIIEHAIIKGSEAGVDPALLIALGEQEYKDRTALLTRLMLEHLIRGTEQAEVFFSKLFIVDAGCRKLVADVLEDKDLKPDYYTGAPLGLEINYQTQM